MIIARRKLVMQSCGCQAKLAVNCPNRKAIPVDLEIKVKALNLAGFNIPNIELQAGQTQQGICLALRVRCWRAVSNTLIVSAHWMFASLT